MTVLTVLPKKKKKDPLHQQTASGCDIYFTIFLPFFLEQRGYLIVLIIDLLFNIGSAVTYVNNETQIYLDRKKKITQFNLANRVVSK